MRKLAAIGISIAAVGLAATPVQATDANGNHAAYIWVVGATTTSDTAMAPDGSTITLTGHGTLMAGPGGVATGGGTFTTSGGSGTWTAISVEGFVSYGPAPAGFPIAGATGGETKLRGFRAASSSFVRSPAGSSRTEPGTVPAHDLTLSWATFSQAADQAGISRRYGGIHFEEGDLDGRRAGRMVAQMAWDKAQSYFNGAPAAHAG